jgi:hypothetical protein
MIFIEIFFTRNILTWFNFSFIFVFYLILRKSYSGVKDFGFIFFIFKDFFNLNQVGIPLLLFVVVIYLTSYLEKVAGEFYVSIINLLLIIGINSLFYENVLSYNTLTNLVLFSVVVTISFISNRGSFRFNKT